MNEREELASIIASPESVDGGPISCGPNSVFASRTADAILAAGYRKPRTISTVEELDALPNGSIIRDDEGDGWQFFGLMGWFVTGGDKDGSESPTLPATVLYEAPND
jgi:hypothetical protein